MLQRHDVRFHVIFHAARKNNERQVHTLDVVAQTLKKTSHFPLNKKWEAIAFHASCDSAIAIRNK